MFIRGEALIGTFTFGFTIHGQRGEWKVSVTGPNGLNKSDETVERDWAPLLNELLASAHDAALRRRFPERHSEAVR
jgi:hypothetical protein